MNTVHRPCLVIACIFAAGIAAGKTVLPLWAWLFFGTCTTLLLLFRRQTYIFYAVIFFLGAIWAQERIALPPDSIAFLSGIQREQVQAVEGEVVSEIRHQRWFHGYRPVFEMEARRILIDGRWQQSSGKLQAELYIDAAPHYGQTLRLHGKLQRIFNGNDPRFSYRRYMQEHGVYWIFRVGRQGRFEIVKEGRGNWAVHTAMEVRRRVTALFKRYLAPAEAGFTAALVLGDHNDMPKDLKQVFINTGTAHILAISGMNMAVVAALFFFVLRLFALPRWLQFSGTIGLLFLYAFLSGWSASVVRASIMGSLLLAAFIFEHETEALNSLGLAAIILLVLDPRNLFDAGFQLSFAAVAGILVLYPHAERCLKPLPSFLRVSMAVSMSAWLATAPFIFYHFRMITPVSVLANIPIVPLADLVMALGLGLAATGGWCPYLGFAFAGCIKASLSAMVIFAAWFNQFPWGHFIWP